MFRGEIDVRMAMGRTDKFLIVSYGGAFFPNYSDWMTVKAELEKLGSVIEACASVDRVSIQFDVDRVAEYPGGVEAFAAAIVNTYVVILPTVNYCLDGTMASLQRDINRSRNIGGAALSAHSIVGCMADPRG